MYELFHFGELLCQSISQNCSQNVCELNIMYFIGKCYWECYFQGKILLDFIL